MILRKVDRNLTKDLTFIFLLLASALALLLTVRTVSREIKQFGLKERSEVRLEILDHDIWAFERQEFEMTAAHPEDSRQIHFSAELSYLARHLTGLIY